VKGKIVDEGKTYEFTASRNGGIEIKGHDLVVKGKNEPRMDEICKDLKGHSSKWDDRPLGEAKIEGLQGKGKQSHIHEYVVRNAPSEVVRKCSHLERPYAPPVRPYGAPPINPPPYGGYGGQYPYPNGGPGPYNHPNYGYEMHQQRNKRENCITSSLMAADNREAVRDLMAAGEKDFDSKATEFNLHSIQIALSHSIHICETFQKFKPGSVEGPCTAKTIGEA
jgi:hypothetical protein